MTHTTPGSNIDRTIRRVERDRRVDYGAHRSQFGALSLPDADVDGGLPVVVLIHGGFWRDTYDLHLMDPLAGDLVDRGFAVWNIEYRRVGADGGGWPATFLDVAAAVDHLARLDTVLPLDVGRVAVVGHSAGGHLALWTAGRGLLPAGAPGAAPRVVPALVVGQGPASDLLAIERDRLSRSAVVELLGESATHPDRYTIAAPRIPPEVQALVVRGTDDTDVPATYTLPADTSGIDVVDVPGDDHFDLIDARSASWAVVVERLVALSGRSA